jgi:ArsR family transcriptional regulator
VKNRISQTTFLSLSREYTPCKRVDLRAYTAPRYLLRGHNSLDKCPYFCKYRNMDGGTSKKRAERVAKYADMFSAMGTEPRLRIMQLLLSAHPEGLVVGDIQGELEIPNSTLSHHLDKLKNEELVHVQRESTFLRYTANTEALQELLQFLYSECCTRNKALKPQDIVEICK